MFITCKVTAHVRCRNASVIWILMVVSFTFWNKHAFVEISKVCIH